MAEEERVISEADGTQYVRVNCAKLIIYILSND